MTTPVELHPLLLSSSATGYQIERSLRFNSADSAYLNRTPAGAGNRQTWTWSGWVKRSALGATQGLFGAYSAANNTDNLWLGFSSGDLFIISRNSDELRRTTQVFRDISAWYHIVVALDTTQATANDRVKVYLNGTQITAFTTTNNPTQNDNQGINQAAEHRIGRRPDNTDYLNSYLTEINFIDGQALTPSSFGETDSATGVWKPKAYTGTYGTNGFYLDFADNTSTTTLGYDAAGSNDWTLNNFSVTAGAGNDSLVDTPTSYGTDTGVGGEVRGNYATLNPLAAPTGFSITASNGNLNVIFGNSTYAKSIGSTFGFSSGKWYFEATVNTGATVSFIGIEPINSVIFSDTVSASRVIGYSSTGYGYYSSGDKRNNNTDSSYGTSYTTNDVIGVAVDMDNGKIWFSKNGTWQASGDPAAGTNAAFTSIPANTYIPGVSAYNSQGWILNFGQRPFAYTAPSGFKALCTQNLPTPTIKQGDDYFNVVTYTGNGTAISNNTVGFQPDFVWIKGRSGATSAQLFDSLRGATKVLISDVNGPESTAANTLTSFDSNGFTVGSNTALNTSTATYVAWNWNAGGSTANNTNGTITSTVRANPTAGFSVVIYGGNGIDGATVGHGLGVVPSMIIQKRRDGNIGGWRVWHSSVFATSGVTDTLYLNLNYAITADGDNISGVSSTTFTTRGDGATNPNGNGCVAYVFAAVDGYSAFGSYTGNGSADGPFVYTGFRPRYILFKCSSSTEAGNANWAIIDTSRSPYNFALQRVWADLSNAEDNNAAYPIDILSNGFKLRNGDANYGHNTNGNTYIYAAFAENPFKYSLAR